MAMKKSNVRLLVMLVIAVTVFMGLALGEEYAKSFMKQRRKAAGDDRANLLVEKAVNRYTQLLSRAYAEGSPRFMEDITTDDQARRVRLYMAYNHFDKKEKMFANLRDFEVIDTKVKGKKAVVKTREEWVYFYIDEGSGAKKEQKNEIYTVEYALVKLADDWLVDELSSQNEDDKQ